MRTLKIEPLTKEAFAPFGDVIETEGSEFFMINNGSTRRYHKLATVETAQPEDQAIISVLTIEKRDEFLVVDRSGSGNNCDEHFFSEDELFLDPHRDSE
ncbi:MAG: hypothetical protein B7Z23_14570 [Pseudomonadales bacterium 32-61-5]|nr:MAG: hypothetical protein B7Z23_14570 [Pseudomonadales bacterium 32-61-5]